MRRFPAAYRLRAWQFHFSPELIRLVTTGLERRTRSPLNLRWGKLSSWDLRCAGTLPRYPSSQRFRRGRIFPGEDRNASVDYRLGFPRCRDRRLKYSAIILIDQSIENQAGNIAASE